ncbi:PfkB family carbohydrate kinase [Burkholderia sp. MR1-5-21]
MRAKVACVGGAVLDRIYTVESLPSRDIKVAAHSYGESGGGMAANAAAAARRLGGDAMWFGRVGDDEIGEHIVSGLKREQIEVFAACIEGAISSHSIVLSDGNGDRAIILYRSPLLDADASWLPMESILSADAVLADNRWIEGAVAALSAARTQGVPGVLDADISNDTNLIKAVEAASHAVFSEQGLSGLFGTDNVELGLQRAARHAPFVAVTLGGKGVAWIDASGDVRHMEAFPVTPRETLGAGDVFHGAFALALAERRTAEEALRFGAVAAALKCTRAGGRDTFPSRSEVDKCLRDW